MYGGYVGRISQVPLDRDFYVVQSRELDRCEDIVGNSLLEQDCRVRREVSGRQGVQESRRVVLTVDVRDREGAPP